MTRLRVQNVFAIFGRGTSIVVDPLDDGVIRVGEIARVALTSGEIRMLKIRGVEMLDGWETGRHVGKVAILVAGIGVADVAVGTTIEVIPASE